MALAASEPGSNLAARRMDALLKEQCEYTLCRGPEVASLLGDKRYNDKVTDFSQAVLDTGLKTTPTA